MSPSYSEATETPRRGRSVRKRPPAWRPISRVWRAPALATSKGIGRVQQPQKAWWPLAAVLGAGAVLVLVPILLDRVVSVIPDDWRQHFGIAAAPHVRDWLSLESVAIVAACLVALRLVIRARKRVVIERFANYSGRPDSEVNGVATQLAAELGSIGALFRQAHSDVLIPPDLGFEQRGGFDCGKEAACFLTANADGLTRVLEGAIASEAKVDVGKFLRIPLGPLLSACNQFVGRKRIAGALISAGGERLVLSAQLIGGHAGTTWKVEREVKRSSASDGPHVLDQMVKELAYQVFTGLSFGASARVSAVEAFGEYLRLYHECSTKPGHRGDLLRRAERQLRHAVSEDENFGVAYYNLGVVCTMLDHAQRSGPASQSVRCWRRTATRGKVHSQLSEDARVAFWEATQRTPEHWHAHYALAVRLFSQIAQLSGADADESSYRDIDRSGQPLEIDEVLSEDDPRREQLELVIRGCDRALAAVPPTGASRAIVHDLRGMAAVRLAASASDSRGYFRAGMRDHRRAIGQSWWELCRAERLARVESSSDDGRVKQAQKNAIASLHNLALAYGRRAMLSSSESRDSRRLKSLAAAIRRERDYRAAERIFQAALDVAGARTERALATHFEHGVVLEKRGDAIVDLNQSRAGSCYARAALSFQQAAEIKPTHAEYAAKQACALAKQARARTNNSPQHGDLSMRARTQAAIALRDFAPDFLCSVAWYDLAPLSHRCEQTIKALEETHEKLENRSCMARASDLRDLWQQLQHASALCDESAGTRTAQVQGTLRSELKALNRTAERYTRNGSASLTSDPAIEPGLDWELDQIAIVGARLLDGTGHSSEAAGVIEKLLRKLGDRGDRDAERVVDFGLRDVLTDYRRRAHASERSAGQRKLAAAA